MYSCNHTVHNVLSLSSMLQWKTGNEFAQYFLLIMNDTRVLAGAAPMVINSLCLGKGTRQGHLQLYFWQNWEPWQSDFIKMNACWSPLQDCIYSKYIDFEVKTLNYYHCIMEAKLQKFFWVSTPLEQRLCPNSAHSSAVQNSRSEINLKMK